MKQSNELQPCHAIWSIACSSDRTVYTHIETRLVSGVSIGFNKNCFVVDVPKERCLITCFA